ncbi:MAG: hypothetical protein J1G30_01200 [Spirochaetales bacterium]|nr:hypothetical protein [Spirochaetales bacterium]
MYKKQRKNILSENVILSSLPKDWKVLKNATTAPVGYTWVYNGKGLFDKGYKQALLRNKEAK